MRLAILGYGNLGRGIEANVALNDDMELKYIFTRRNPSDIKTSSNAKVVCSSEIETYKDDIDVLILCGGSATDLPEQTPKYAKMFNVVDSFDTHAKIPEHFDKVNSSAISCDKVAIISVGWDPGLFSLNRMISNAILPKGCDYTFWGKGISQGHSDAIRRIEGVLDARQYTIPIDDAINTIKDGKTPEFTARQMHRRECFVVVEDGADKAKIEQEIKTMPNYFEPYDTSVHFISEEELKQNHSKIPHGGFVIRSGQTGFNFENKHIIEYNLKLDSNPHFTSCVLLAYARAAYRLYQEKDYGCKTVFDIAPKYLINKNDDFLRKTML